MLGLRDLRGEPSVCVFPEHRAGADVGTNQSCLATYRGRRFNSGRSSTLRTAILLFAWSPPFSTNAGTDDFYRGMAGNNSALRSFAKPGSHAGKPSSGFRSAFPYDFQGFQGSPFDLRLLP